MLEKINLTIPAGQDRGHRRRERLRQIDPPEPAAWGSMLRPRVESFSTASICATRPGIAARAHRPGVAGALHLQCLYPRQHRAGPAGSDAGRGDRRRPGGRPRRLHCRIAAALRHDHRRTGGQPVRRAAATAGHRPRPAAELDILIFDEATSHLDTAPPSESFRRTCGLPWPAKRSCWWPIGSTPSSTPTRST